jgi:hypothetical protein
MAVVLPVVSKFDDSGIKKAKSAFSKLGGSLKGTIAALGVATSMVAITNALKDASKAAVTDVKSQALLATQLRNTVGATDETIRSSEAFIKSLMLQTSIADETLRPALASLVRATGDVSKSQTLLTLSTNIAAGTGKDLSAVSIAVGKAAAGQTTALYKLVPSLKGSSDWAKEAGKQFAGMAEQAARNDPYQRLNTLFGEMQETIGMALLPYLNEVADYFASPAGQKNLQDFALSVTDAVKAIGDLGKGMADLAPIADPVFGWLNGLIAAFTGNAQRASEIFQGMFGTMSKQTNAGRAINQTSASRLAGQRNPGSGGLNKAISNYKPPTANTSGVAKKTPAQLAAEKAKKALQDFQKSMKDMADVSNLTKLSSNLGDFQQSVVDTFDGINKKIAEGLANKTIGTKGLASLRSFLKSQQALLEENARQRDAIIAKRSLAEALYNDVKSALTGTGNLANLLDTQTQAITTSVTKIVDGFTITTKQTVDQVVGGQGVISRLKEVVAKTKAFAQQLTDLKALGLNPDLFKQIVDAGPDVGSQLAKEILDGGSDSVKALNDTFTELQTVSASVAEQTAVVMYNNGVSVAGGLVAGLMSQEAALVAAAQTLADAFNAAYQANIMALAVPEAPTVAPKTSGTTTNVTNKITVKASPVNTKATGQAVAAVVAKYAKTSGGVILRGGR